MEDLKIRVNSEAESEEAQCLFFELGYIWLGGHGSSYFKINDNFKYITAYMRGMSLAQGTNGDAKKEITMLQLRDMVVLKRNDVGDANAYCNDNSEHYYISSDGKYFYYLEGYESSKWMHSSNNISYLEKHVKPIEKPMKEFLDPANDHKFIVTDKPFFDWIEVPEGADTLAGDSSTRYFWKYGVGEKGNMIIGVGESLTRYSGWTGCKDSADVWLDCVNDDSFKIIWQRETQPEALPLIDDEPKYDPEDIKIAKDCDLDELAKEYKLPDRYDGETDEDYRYMLEHYIDLENYIAKETLNDKVASAEVARQEFIGAPFSDLPEVNFEAVDDFVESNVEQGVKHPHYKKDISHLDTLDIYRVTELFNPYACGAHIAKKALCSGQRGHKDLLTDIQDIIDTAERWKEMLIEDEKAK